MDILLRKCVLLIVKGVLGLQSNPSITARSIAAVHKLIKHSPIVSLFKLYYLNPSIKGRSQITATKKGEGCLPKLTKDDFKVRKTGKVFENS